MPESPANTKPEAQIPQFPPGDFYDCSPDAETLTHEDPEEALEYWIDSLSSLNCDTSAVIRENCPVTVYASVRGTVSPKFLESVVLRTMDLVNESFVEEYGDPDDSHSDLESSPEIVAKLRTALGEYLATGYVWRCDPAGEVTLNAEQVEAILREYAPERWDEDKEGEQSDG